MEGRKLSRAATAAVPIGLKAMPDSANAVAATYSELFLKGIACII